MLLFWDFADKSGRSFGLWDVSVASYIGIVFTVSLKLFLETVYASENALRSLRNHNRMWTPIFQVVTLGCALFTFVWFAVLDQIWSSGLLRFSVFGFRFSFFVFRFSFFLTCLQTSTAPSHLSHRCQHSG
jgi:hypothetical protein